MCQVVAVDIKITIKVAGDGELGGVVRVAGDGDLNRRVIRVDALNEFVGVACGTDEIAREEGVAGIVCVVAVVDSTGRRVSPGVVG